MTTSRTYAATGALVALVGSFVVLVFAFSVESVATAGPSLDGCTGAYGWPVRPVDQPHPVRGNFGDPRTRYDGPRTDETLLEGDGALSFHQGLDINAPDGSPVYAVASGTVVRARGRRVTVACRNRIRSFQYWHIYEAVRVGQHVDAGETVVGFILPKREHVHLTELRKGQAVNPLAPGHLTPYRDTTSPRVLAISIRGDEAGQEELSGDAGGRVFFVAEAVDTPALPVRGRWEGDFPVTPALITWRIEQDDRVVASSRVAWDVRATVPKNDRFWGAFARGTYQNWPVFGTDKYRFEHGKYLFRLSVAAFDTRSLGDGDYELIVVATDTGRNRDEQRLEFSIHNALSGS